MNKNSPKFIVHTPQIFIFFVVRKIFATFSHFTAGYFEKSLFGKSRGILKIPHFPSISLVSLEKRTKFYEGSKGNRNPFCHVHLLTRGQ
jgi:hypothetical protein